MRWPATGKPSGVGIAMTTINATTAARRPQWDRSHEGCAGVVPRLPAGEAVWLGGVSFICFASVIANLVRYRFYMLSHLY